jgi:hypothetical protein
MRPPGFPSAKRTAKRVLLGNNGRAPASTSAAAVLGADHPLVPALGALEAVVMQSRVVGAVLGTSIVAEIAGAHRAVAITFGGAIVLAGLVLVSIPLRQRIREHAVNLILAGRESLPIRPVQAQCRRLLAPRTRRSLARSLDAMVHRALRPPNPPVRGMRPIFDVAVVTGVSRELVSVASLLRADRVPVAGVALAERLLTDADSPLYGHEVGPLRDELDGLRAILRRG